MLGSRDSCHRARRWWWTGLIAGVQVAWGVLPPPELPESLCHPGGRDAIVVFVHGWRGDGAGTWKRFPELACADPGLAEAEIVTIDYPTFLTSSNNTILELAAWVGEELKRAFPDDERPVMMIAHSMGGLVGREIALSRLVSAAAPPPVLVEIATPQLGTTKTVALAGRLGISKRLTRDMRQDSSYLRNLQQRWNDAQTRERGIDTFCFWSAQDGVVPRHSALACDRPGTPFPQWNHREVVKPENFGDPRYSRPVAPILAALRGIEPTSSGGQSPGRVRVLHALHKCYSAAGTCEIDVLLDYSGSEKALLTSARLEVLHWESEQLLGGRTLEPTRVDIDLTGARAGDVREEMIARELTEGLDRLLFTVSASDVPPASIYYWRVVLTLETSQGPLVVVPQHAEYDDGSFRLGLPCDRREWGRCPAATGGK